MLNVADLLVSSTARRRWIGAAAFAIMSALASQAPAQARELPDFPDLVEKVGPSVVNIRTTERGRLAGAGPGGAERDPNIEEFLRRFGIPMPGGRGGPRNDDEPQQAQPRGVGSGFILTADGFVMTNAHVVEGADEVIVTLTDKREYKAKLIGADKRTDVAVVKIDATGLPAVRIGDVNRLRVGEWVMAIGSPFGLANSVTAGIVSAKARETGDYLPFIQTDVAINPGNSGGPLINMRGEVVGINSQIYSRSGGYMGIAFAIPIDEATRVSDQLRSSGRVIRGRIGVTIAAVTKEVAESIGLGKAAGAMVRGVEAGGPADKAGIEAGDIITRVDGKVIESSVDLPRIIGSIKPGARAALQVYRRGAYRDMSVTVVEFEAEQQAKAPTPEPAASAAAKSALGLTVVELTDGQRKEMKVRGGVRVESAEGAAARAGMRSGDVVLAMNNTEITDVRQFMGLAAKVEKSKSVNLMVRRGEWVNYVVIPAGR
ncbi:Do family serine endopeptidase [Ideonella sp. A 288]|uniref:Do family serine endopeptidase n=1 Tax=Ideonella sp. A 288 TaxID=1962181 RepID=UPI000B4A78FB|nr:Do family serine endopeptidase [Ideonella sp. A 288]